MRGSALRLSGYPGLPCAARVLEGAIQPRSPRPRGALPLVGSPAPRVFPLAIQTQEALLPETPADAPEPVLAGAVMGGRP
jgi:hypothetical protein